MPFRFHNNVGEDNVDRTLRNARNRRLLRETKVTINMVVFSSNYDFFKLSLL